MKMNRILNKYGYLPYSIEVKMIPTNIERSRTISAEAISATVD